MSQAYRWHASQDDDEAAQLAAAQSKPKAKPAKPAPSAKAHNEDEKLDAKATLAAYRELGPEYQDAVVESFLSRIDQRRALQGQPPYLPVVVPTNRGKLAKSNNFHPAGLILSLVLAIPLTAIAISSLGLIGLVVTWGGIITVAGIWRRGLDGRSKGYPPPALPPGF